MTKFKFNNKVFIVAELSANHGQDINIALATIQAAKNAGADAIKIQTYTPDTLTIDCDNKYFKLKSGTIWDGKTLYGLYNEAYTPWEWHKELKDYANKLGLIFFSTPFDKSSVDFLEKLNVPLYKISSFEILDIPLIEYVASKGKPMLISTGIASLDDINLALNACKNISNNNIVLLKCTSSYPAKISDANLISISDMRDRFNVKVGLSDHTLGITVPVLSVAYGATVIEKHFILDKKIGGPDASFSLDPHEFSAMVKAVREAEEAIGKIDYKMTLDKKNNRLLSKSIFITKDINKNETFNESNIRIIRPGYGLHPINFKNVLGKKAKINLKRGTPLSKKHIVGFKY
jgi:pseudaminic acid synthase